MQITGKTLFTYYSNILLVYKNFYKNFYKNLKIVFIKISGMFSSVRGFPFK